jgi:hypothetical protein
MRRCIACGRAYCRSGSSARRRPERRGWRVAGAGQSAPLHSPSSRQACCSTKRRCGVRGQWPRQPVPLPLISYVARSWDLTLPKCAAQTRVSNSPLTWRSSSSRNRSASAGRTRLAKSRAHSRRVSGRRTTPAIAARASAWARRVSLLKSARVDVGDCRLPRPLERPPWR